MICASVIAFHVSGRVPALTSGVTDCYRGDVSCTNLFLPKLIAASVLLE